MNCNCRYLAVGHCHAELVQPCHDISDGINTLIVNRRGMLALTQFWW